MKKVFIILIFLILLPVKVFALDKVDINSASLAQLDEITGIGPKYAQAIIDSRPFSSVDDLERVKGIGPKTLQKIKDQGLACVDCASAVIASEPAGERGNPEPAQETLDSGLRQNDTATLAPVIYPSGIFINEILPNPTGADETNEWIELYNSNNIDVDLSGWQLQDLKGTQTTYTISQGTKILANNFLVFKRPDTKIMLNNDEDGINLLTPDKKIVDSVNFTSAPLGQSYNKINSGWKYSTTQTPGAVNIITAVASKTPSASSGPNGLSKTKNSVNNNGVEAGLADISLPAQAGQTTNPWFLFFTALAITIISAIIVLLIKLKIFKNHVRT